MALIDFILNVAGALLWLNWRAARLGWQAGTSPTPTPGDTPRRAEPWRPRRWHFLAALAGLICLRAVFYRHLGPALGWTADLELGAVTLFFRSDQFWLVLFFSVLSFGRALAILYCWLLTLQIVNRDSNSGDSVSCLVRWQLGRVAGWPLYAQIALPWLAVAASWTAIYPLLTCSGIISPASSLERIGLQGLLVGFAACFSLKYLIPALLFAHWVAGYVYFGNSPLLEFLGVTARKLLAPLRPLPLRVGKLDLAPLAGIVVAILALHVLPNWLLGELHRRHLTIWPR